MVTAGGGGGAEFGTARRMEGKEVVQNTRRGMMVGEASNSVESHVHVGAVA